MDRRDGTGRLSNFNCALQEYCVCCCRALGRLLRFGEQTPPQPVGDRAGGCITGWSVNRTLLHAVLRGLGVASWSECSGNLDPRFPEILRKTLTEVLARNGRRNVWETVVL